MDKEEFFDELNNCRLCPRHCKANRNSGETGFCGIDGKLRAARAALHFWEEPVLSGKRGSGAVFFSGCNLRCVFCQNHDIALGKVGKEISVNRLSEIFFELKEKGAYNINLVTGTPYIPHIRKAIMDAKDRGFDLPFVFNCGGYEDVDALKMLDGLIDIYLPDFKYISSETASRYSFAPDYFEKASAALAEMHRQVPKCEFTIDDGATIMKRGTIVRHLLLPGKAGEAKKILRYLHETYGSDIYISIMNQYTAMQYITGSTAYPELSAKVSDAEYDRVTDFAVRIGIENGFTQEGETAKESFIPSFDFEGI